MNAEDRMLEHADRLQAERDEWKRKAHEEHAAADASEARITALKEALREGIDKLGAMMNEHTPLGQHESGEIEYCSGDACREADRFLTKGRVLLDAGKGTKGEPTHVWNGEEAVPLDAGKNTEGGG